MNREDVITFSTKSHLDVYGLGKDFKKFADTLERFAELVARKLDEEYPVKFASVKAFEDWCAAIRANEREACEHICVENGALGLAAAIRARGEK